MNQQLRIAAIVNPAAGGDREHALAVMQDAEGTAVQALATTVPGDAANIAYKLAVSADPPDIIAGVGGDGTVAEVATGLFRARESGVAAVPPLLVAPAGTGNSTYRGLWNDEPWEAVLGHAIREEAAIRTIDLARITRSEHVVVLGSGSGLFAATLLAARDRPEKGRDRLMAAALAAMEGYVPYPGRVSVDGKACYEGGIVETITAGFRYRGGLLCLVPESVADDRQLDVTIVTATADMSAFARAALQGNVYEVPGIHMARGAHVTIERLDGDPLLYEHDGELMPQDMRSCDISVIPAALRVLSAADALPWFGAR